MTLFPAAGPPHRVAPGRPGRAVLAGRYELIEPVGRGGMSVVWQAWDRLAGQPRAVKLIAEPYAADPGVRSLLHREATLMAAVSHPGVVRVHDDGHRRAGRGTPPFLALEFVPGGTLRQHLTAAPLPARVAIGIGAKIAAALGAIHAAGIVHCDIAPANIMICGADVTVVDFGIAEFAAAPPGWPVAGAVFGTAAYVAPERLTGSAVGPAADVYALGILLYRMLTGRRPWTTSTSVEMLVAHVSAPPDPLPRLPGVPPAVAELCDRCLAKDPAARPSAIEAEAVLAAATDDRTAAAFPRRPDAAARAARSTLPLLRPRPFPESARASLDEWRPGSGR